MAIGANYVGGWHHHLQSSDWLVVLKPFWRNSLYITDKLPPSWNVLKQWNVKKCNSLWHREEIRSGSLKWCHPSLHVIRLSHAHFHIHVCINTDLWQQQLSAFFHSASSALKTKTKTPWNIFSVTDTAEHTCTHLQCKIM